MAVKFQPVQQQLKSPQSLNLENAVFERETDYVSQGKALKIESTRFLSADKPNLGIIKYSLTSDKAARVKISTGIDYNIWDLNGPHLLNLSPKKKNGVLLVHGVTNEASKKVAIAEAVDLNFGKETHKLGIKKTSESSALVPRQGKHTCFTSISRFIRTMIPLRLQ